MRRAQKVWKSVQEVRLTPLFSHTKQGFFFSPYKLRVEEVLLFIPYKKKKPFLDLYWVIVSIKYTQKLKGFKRFV